MNVSRKRKLCTPQQQSTCEIAEDKRSILFMPCGLRSHNSNDVEHRFCAACGRYFPALPETET